MVNALSTVMCWCYSFYHQNNLHKKVRIFKVPGLIIICDMKFTYSLESMGCFVAREHADGTGWSVKNPPVPTITAHLASR